MTAILLSLPAAETPAALPEIPGDMGPFMGDPERGPEPSERHAATRTYPDLDPIVLSNGHPLRDFGHFRMSREVSHGRRTPFVLQIPKDEMAATKERWERHAFRDGEHLHYSLARPADNAVAPEHGFPLVVLQPGIGGIGKKSTGENIWLTGHSMGGSSTWYIMLARPDLVAAAVPLAGIPPIDLEEAERIKDIPIWMMMGNNDPWSGSFPYIRTYQNLVQAGAERVRFWEIQDIGHSGGAQSLWPIAEFLFSFRRGGTGAAEDGRPWRNWRNQDGEEVRAVLPSSRISRRWWKAGARAKRGNPAPVDEPNK
ncbi:MAG: hypothetical protein LAT83_19440 [Kiritimatiellae bacterium]|nr:hypothetical protein [Kiritimatiellia bacterium]